MAKSLLERQARLVEYMTSGATIFGQRPRLVPVEAIEGVDCTLLRIEAQFSYAKRMGKIAAVLPRTFELLGNAESELVREFVESCPPTTINRLENARQFYRFLSLRWKYKLPDPPYLCDVAACEIAFAEVDARIALADVPRTPRSGIRRSPAVVLLRCSYDVRSIFETPFPTLPRMQPPPCPPPLAKEGQKGGRRTAERAAPVKRETPVVISVPPGASRPQAFEVVPAVFDLLAALDDWTDPAPSLPSPACEEGLGRGELDFAKLLANLAACGLVEVNQ